MLESGEAHAGLGAAAVDMGAHTGLRGLLAAWVMLFHCLLYSEHPVDLQGSSLMPFFFMLSGFSLSVVYGEQTGDDGVFTDKGSYLRNRFARTFPVYYVCTLLAVPLWLAGYGGVDPSDTGGIAASVATSVVPVNTFFIFLLGGPIDGPSWTVCSLAVMWLLFPYSYPAIRQSSTERLITDSTNYFWLQLILVFAIFPIVIIFLGFWPAFAAATMQPLVRYPVFLMGALAGELCRRRAGRALPWPNGGLGFFPACCCCRVEYDTALTANGAAERQWAQRCWNSCTLLLAVLLSVAAVDAVVRYGGGEGGGILGGWWLQAVVPFIQLEILVALTRESGESSPTQQLLLHPVSQWLGRLSLGIYLVHWVVIYYLCWLMHGAPLRWPETYECEDGPEHSECVAEIEDFRRARTLPVWGVFVVVAASLAAAEALQRAVEAPGRRVLGAHGVGGAYRQTEMAGREHTAFSPVTASAGHLRENGVPIFDEQS